ncbi:hypothetical protein B0H16DRAFT_1477155 [Mycena metata]|uniref:Uncharacterized protein n=1 Tax=Mycena metata TaxID=1033252 RepID=A0AAD7H9L7_9AGAR|nr:hypothetical protein B0H16DRAFT_1477155 [Mycena metata]
MCWYETLSRRYGCSAYTLGNTVTALQRPFTASMHQTQITSANVLAHGPTSPALLTTGHALWGANTWGWHIFRWAFLELSMLQPPDMRAVEARTNSKVFESIPKRWVYCLKFRISHSSELELTLQYPNTSKGVASFYQVIKRKQLKEGATIAWLKSRAKSSFAESLVDAMVLP